MAEKVLLVCTSTIPNVKRAIGILHADVFRSPQIDLLCSSAELVDYERQLDIQNVLVFPHRQEYRAALRLWKRILKERYNVVAVLWCLDPERSKAKFFAFLCGSRRLLVFNENLDCAYLKPGYLKAIVSARARDGRLLPKSWSNLVQRPLQSGFWRILRFLLLPLRFVILMVAAGSLFLSKSKNNFTRF